MADILLDDREGSRDLIRYHPLDELCQLCRVDFGDVVFSGNGPSGPISVGIEVKSLGDLISSMDTGRLQATQLPGLLSTYDSVWLLYYGLYRAGAHGELEIRQGQNWRQKRLGPRPVSYSYVEGFLLDLVAVGMNVKYVASESQAAQWIASIYRWYQKPWDKHHGLRAIDKSHNVGLMPSMSEGVKIRTAVASQLPGVGFERALAAAHYFDSVTEMMNAPESEWMRIPGIGKVVAKAVVESIRRRGK